MLRGIDISHWNKIKSFAAMKENNIDFVILKAGGSDKGFYTDSKFEENYKKAKAHDLFIGAYYFVGENCTSYEDGYADAMRFYDIIKGKQFEMPVYIDLESTSSENKKGATEACIGFCDYMEEMGYYVGIYASDVSGFKDKLILSKLDQFDKWVARYGKQPENVKNYGMWQYSSTGTIPKVCSGYLDLDISYLNYPEIIKKRGLNGYASNIL